MNRKITLLLFVMVTTTAMIFPFQKLESKDYNNSISNNEHKIAIDNKIELRLEDVVDSENTLDDQETRSKTSLIHNVKIISS